MASTQDRKQLYSLENIYHDSECNRPITPVVLSNAKDDLDLAFMMQPTKINKTPTMTYIINVSGKKFEIGSQTFLKIQPILTVECNSMSTTPTGSAEYFVERQPECFSMILDYFQNGELHMPNDICPSVYNRELEYWAVDWRLMSQCCLRRFIGFRENEKTLTAFDRRFVGVQGNQQQTSAFSPKPSRWERIRTRGWAILDDPQSSVWAKAYLTLATAFVILSIFVLAASSHSTFTRGLTSDEWEEYMTDDEVLRYWELIHPLKPRPPKHTTSTHQGTTDLPRTSIGSTNSHHIGKRSLDETADFEDETFNPEETNPVRTSKNNDGAEELFSYLKNDLDTRLRHSSAAQKLLKTMSEKHAGKTDNVIIFLSDMAKMSHVQFSLRQLFQGGRTELNPRESNKSIKTLLSYIKSLSQDEKDNRSYYEASDDEKKDKNSNSYDWMPGSDEEIVLRRRKRSTSNNTVPKANMTEEEGVCIRLSKDQLAILLDFITNNYESSEVPSQLPNGVFTIQNWLGYLEMICILYFTVEFVIRLIFAPARLRYLCSFLTLVDVVSTVTMYAAWIIGHLNAREKYSSSYIDALNCLQIVRIFRFIRLVKNVIGFKVLIFSVRSSWKELFLLLLYILMAVTTFSSLVYFCERDNMQSIPDAAWWVIVTMTTVGYGDMAPITLVGKLIGCACALSGVLLIAVTVPIFVNNFLLFYDHSKIHDSDEYKKKSLTRPTDASAISSPGGKGEDGNSTCDKISLKSKVTGDAFDYELPTLSPDTRSSSFTSKTISITKVQPVINN